MVKVLKQLNPKMLSKKKQDGEIIIHKYKFIEKCNDNLFLYEEVKQKYKRCFTKFDLGLVKEIIKPGIKLNKTKIKV